MENTGNETTGMTFGTFSASTDPTDYVYDSGPTFESGLCEKSWVRELRGQYEAPIFSVIFILGALGNILVVLIYTTVRNRLKTMTDMYLLHLALADLLFLCTLPFWAVDTVKGWDFGVAFCKIVSAVYKINFFSSMLLLTCISVDRYIAIVQVIKAQNFKKQRLFYSKLACLTVWIVSALLALPDFIFAQVNAGKFCALVYNESTNNQTKIFVLSLQICMGFCLPLLIMIFCYSVIIHTLLQAKSFEKHKALRVIFAVVFVFILSQLPHNALLIVEANQAVHTTITDCGVSGAVDVAGQFAKTLAYTHACVNPLLYAFIGVRFRQDLLRIARICSGCLGAGGLSKSQAVPKRPSIMSDTDTTPALSI
ncbi:C-C chemokine receptor type 9-like [Salarias fasciatus]|uniref:C-C chemokine receptor type 9-like n=2 Tax=Salarias fasciatus TaxID=181472 RepID=A0A672FU83_SALFA|nr:C-C chemokine receptor type 9-like [Salarias fasciatus]